MYYMQYYLIVILIGGRGGYRSFQLCVCLVFCYFFYDEILMLNEYKYVVVDVMVIENVEY